METCTSHYPMTPDQSRDSHRAGFVTCFSCRNISPAACTLTYHAHCPEMSTADKGSAISRRSKVLREIQSRYSKGGVGPSVAVPPVPLHMAT